MKASTLTVYCAAALLVFIAAGLAGGRPPKKSRNAKENTRPAARARQSPDSADVPPDRYYSRSMWGDLNVTLDNSIPGQVVTTASVELWHGGDMPREIGHGKYVVAVDLYGVDRPDRLTKPIASGLSSPFVSVHGQSVTRTVEVRVPATSGDHWLNVQVLGTKVQDYEIENEIVTKSPCLATHLFQVNVK